LAALQRTMGAALMLPLSQADEMADANADRYIKPNDRMSAHERLEIYARQYWFRLLDCLYDDYPGLRALLGQKRFHALCRAYLEAHPSASWTLRNLGSKLETFLRARHDLTGAKSEAAIDIARFEWAQVVAFDEAQKRPLLIDDLLGVSADELHLGLQPYLTLLELDYAVDTYFMAARSGERATRGEASNALVESPQRSASKRVPLPKRQKLWLVVHRCDNDIYFKRIEREEFILLQRLRAGDLLSQALEHALIDTDESIDWAVKVREWLNAAAALGWFCLP
jgi:hypothetical protein